MRKARIFTRQDFASTKDWIYFSLEFDLELCDHCLLSARKRPRETPSERVKPMHPWRCQECAPVLHPDLIQALRTRSNVQTSCHLCHEPVSLAECWISEDCQRLYCKSHLRPLAGPPPVRSGGIGSWRVRSGGVPTPAPGTLTGFRTPTTTRSPGHAPVSGTPGSGTQSGEDLGPEAVYDGSRLVEVDLTEVARWRSRKSEIPETHLLENRSRGEPLS